MVRTILMLAIAALTMTACSEQDSPPTTAPTSADVEVPATPPEADALLNWAAEEFGEDGYLDMQYAEFDLNGDGTNELLAYFISPMVCGSGGCNLYIFEQGEGALVERGHLTVTRLPVGLGEGNEGGWRDLVVTIGGGGIEGGLRNVPWTGEAYHSNPTVPPALPVDTMETELLGRE